MLPAQCAPVQHTELLVQCEDWIPLGEPSFIKIQVWVWCEKGNSAAGWLLQPPAMHLTQLAHSNSFNCSGVSLAAWWLHPSLADETHGSHKSAGLVRFNCCPEPPLILWVSQHGKEMPASLPNTKIYAIAVFHAQTQCHNPGKWQYINTHING